MAVPDKLPKRLSAIPVFEKLRLQLCASAAGLAQLIAPYDPSYDGVFDSFHGGLLATLADTASCVAVLTLTDADAVITTTDMHIFFLAPCRSDATAEAHVIKFGKTLCPVHVEVRNANGIHVQSQKLRI